MGTGQHWQVDTATSCGVGEAVLADEDHLASEMAERDGFSVLVSSGVSR